MSHRNNILLSKWHLIENHPLLREKYREPPLISYMYRRGKSLTDILVKAKLLKRSKNYYIKKQRESCLACQPLLTPFSTSALGYLLPEVWTKLQFCLGLKSDGGTILVAVLGSTSPAHRLGIWNLEFISLSTEVNLSLLVVSLLLSAFSALDCKLVTALSKLRTKSWTDLLL